MDNLNIINLCLDKGVHYKTIKFHSATIGSFSEISKRIIFLAPVIIYTY
ncbi:hypothetical protein APP_23990 [Aeribacillus pallidus]|nr:hypothetical protein APP_23990 [Aeribacillus pallidus]